QRILALCRELLARPAHEGVLRSLQDGAELVVAVENPPLRVDDADADRRRLEERGVEVAVAPRRLDDAAAPQAEADHAAATLSPASRVLSRSCAATSMPGSNVSYPPLPPSFALYIAVSAFRRS